MAYKYFGRLAGKTHTAQKSLTESAPPNTLTPFNPQAPATKLLAYGEDATSLTFNRALSALASNVDHIAAVLDAPTTKYEIIQPYRQTIDGDWTEGQWNHGCVSLGQQSMSGIETGQEELHMPEVASLDPTPSYWVHLGIHKSNLPERVRFFRVQNSIVGSPQSTGYNLHSEVTSGAPNPEIDGHAVPSVHHIARPEDAYLNTALHSATQSYFDYTYKTQGTQQYLGTEDHGVVIHIPPIERMKPNIAPYAMDWHSEPIYKWDADGVYLKSSTFASLNLRPGCFVEISGDGDESVNKGNNGLFQVAAIGKSDHLPSMGGPGDKAILTRGGLCKVTVRDWRIYGRGELVSWASAPNHMDQEDNTAQKPGLRKNYAHVAYIIPRPDITGNPTDEPGDVYLASYAAADDAPDAIGFGPATKAGTPAVAGSERYSGRYRYGDIGSPDQEGVVRDHTGSIIMDALQNHGILPGTRLYHGHAHFYPGNSPWGTAYPAAYSEVMGELDGVPDGIVGPGEPVVFDTETMPGKVWPCAPSGFVLNPSFSFHPENSLYAGEYCAEVKTLTTVKESLSPNNAVKGDRKKPEISILRAWHKFIRTGHISPSNAPWNGAGHSSDPSAAIIPPKGDDLNVMGAPTRTILGGDLWHVVFEHHFGTDHGSLQSAYNKYLQIGGMNEWVGDHASVSVGPDKIYYPVFLNSPVVGRPSTRARFSSISADHAVIYDVNVKPDGEWSTQGWDGWDYGMERGWPIEVGTILAFPTVDGNVSWKVAYIAKAPYVDDAQGRGMIPGYGLNAAYNTDYSASPLMRGPNDIGASSHKAGFGNVIWVNPLRPFTTVLPGGDTLSDGGTHEDGWNGSFAKGEIAHLTRSNNDLYISLHRLCSRDNDHVRAEVAVKYASSSAQVLDDNGAAYGQRSYDESMVGGDARSTRMLLTDPTTQTFGSSPEIGAWDVPNIGLDEMHSTYRDGNYPKHGVYLSSNYSKVNEKYTYPNPGGLENKPAFDARSTPIEMQDRSILGSIEGVLLGNYSPFHESIGTGTEGGRGLYDADSFGALSNGVIKGGRAWIKRQEIHNGASDAVGNLWDNQVLMTNAYLHVGGAKWFQLAQTLTFAVNGNYLISWCADRKKYITESITEHSSGLIENSGPPTTHWEVGQDARKICCYIASVSGGVVQSVTDVRLRVGRQDQKTNIYVGSINPLHGQSSHFNMMHNGGYIDDSMNFSTLGEAFAALTFWTKNSSINRRWTVEVVGPTFESYWRWDKTAYDSNLAPDDSAETRGIEFPIKIPCNGVTVRGIRGKNAGDGKNDDLAGSNFLYAHAGWEKGDNVKESQEDDRNKSPVIYWKHPLDRPVPGLFDLDGRYGITFENLSFHYQGTIDSSFSSHTDWGPDYRRDVPQDVVFCAGNEAYLDEQLQDIDPGDQNLGAHGRDREAFDHLYGSHTTPSNMAYSGGWKFSNLYVRGGGGLLTTLDARYSLDNVIVKDCHAHDVMSFVTMGIDLFNMPHSSWDHKQQRGKHHTRVVIENNKASFPGIRHIINGQTGETEIHGTLTHYAPGTFNAGGPFEEQWEDPFEITYGDGAGYDGEITPNGAKYFCGVYASQCKEIYVKNNTFKSFYAGVVFGRPLKMNVSPASGFNQEPFCEGYIESNVIQNTQSHGVYVLSQTSPSNIHVKNNTIKDPGIPYGAGEPWSGSNAHPNIFDHEAWGIKLLAGGTVCSGNVINNTWRTSPELNWGSGNEGHLFCDRTGTAFPAFSRLYPTAGGIYAYSTKTGTVDPSNPLEGECVGVENIITNNHILLSGRATFGVLISTGSYGTQVMDNKIIHEGSPVQADVPDYSSQDFMDNLFRYPWGVWTGKQCNRTQIVGNQLGANVFIAEESPNSIISGNLVSMPYSMSKPKAQNGDGGCLVYTSSWGTSIINNKLSCGNITMGGVGTGVSDSRITGNNLAPFGEVRIDTSSWNVLDNGATAWTAITINGSGSNIVVDDNNTNFGDITAASGGRWHNMKVTNNNTGHLSTSTDHPELDPTTPDYVGGHIWVRQGDGCSITNNNTSGGFIALGDTSSWNDNWSQVVDFSAPGASGSWDCYNSSVSNNRTHGGPILVHGYGATITANNTRNDKNSTNNYFQYDGQIRVYNSSKLIVSNNNVQSGIVIQDCRVGNVSDNIFRGTIELVDAPDFVVADNNGALENSYDGTLLLKSDITVANSSGTTVQGNKLIRQGGITYRNYGDTSRSSNAYNAGVVRVFPGSNTNSPNSWYGGSVPAQTAGDTIERLGGEVRISASKGARIVNNQVARIFCEGSDLLRIQGNLCAYGGARPKNKYNWGIKIEGQSDNYLIDGNEVKGNIQITAADGNIGLSKSAASSGGMITGNRVGTESMTGAIHISNGNTIGTGGTGDWRGGGGMIVVDEIGGCHITNNHLNVGGYAGAHSGYNSNNVYDGCEFGSIYLNRRKRASFRLNTASSPNFTISWPRYQKSVYVANNTMGSLWIAEPSWIEENPVGTNTFRAHMGLLPNMTASTSYNDSGSNIGGNHEINGTGQIDHFNYVLGLDFNWAFSGNADNSGFVQHNSFMTALMSLPIAAHCAGNMLASNNDPDDQN